MNYGLLIDILSWVALMLGGFFFITGAFGLKRMPDLFTRMHATSISDTLGAGLLIVGMMLQAGPTLVSVKLVLILLVLLLTGPVATHALAHAALHDDVEPLIAGKDGTLKPVAHEKAIMTLEELSSGKSKIKKPSKRRKSSKR